MKKIVNLLACFALVSMVAISCEDKSGTTPGGENPDNGGGTEKPEAPKADFTYDATGLEVLFTNTSTGATAYLWDFGDESTSTEKSPSHSYAAAGEYTVTLTVSNSENVTAKKTETLTIAGAVKAYFSYKAQTGREGKYGKIISFDATSSENPASVEWDFGDGTKMENGTEFKPVHEYADFGTYTVKATVTGEAGDTDIYEAKVEVIAYTELLKGGSMEKDDAQYWKFKDVAGYFTHKEGTEEEPSYEEWDGHPSFAREFGYTEDRPKNGEGGCLRLNGAPQGHDWGYKAAFYQAIDLTEGDVLEISAEMKWGENTNDNGLLWWCLSENEADFGVDKKPGVPVFESFNWWSVDGDGNGSTPLPPFDGNFAGDANYSAEGELGYSGDGSPVFTYTVAKTGTYYFGVEVRNVWGLCYGPDVNYYFDNLSVKIKL